MIKEQVPQINKLFLIRKKIKDCIPQYLAMLFSGYTDKSCRKYAFGIPVSYLKYVPGWPHLFLNKSKQAGLKVYVIEVDTQEDWQQVKDLPIDGIVTNRIELIGPMSKS